jgi:hypothetical protein
VSVVSMVITITSMSIVAMIVIVAAFFIADYRQHFAVSPLRLSHAPAPEKLNTS